MLRKLSLLLLLCAGSIQAMEKENFNDLCDEKVQRDNDLAKDFAAKLYNYFAPSIKINVEVVTLSADELKKMIGEINEKLGARSLTYDENFLRYYLQATTDESDICAPWVYLAFEMLQKKHNIKVHLDLFNDKEELKKKKKTKYYTPEKMRRCITKITFDIEDVKAEKKKRSCSIL